MADDDVTVIGPGSRVLLVPNSGDTPRLRTVWATIRGPGYGEVIVQFADDADGDAENASIDEVHPIPRTWIDEDGDGVETVWMDRVGYHPPVPLLRRSDLTAWGAWEIHPGQVSHGADALWALIVQAVRRG